MTSLTDSAWFWIALALIGLGGSALFSGLETGAYSLNRVRLHILAQRKNPAALTLRQLMADPQRLLATLLIGNNVVNYLGTASLAILFEKAGMRDWKVVVLNVAIVTPALFVFGETLPKDLFAAYSDTLMYRLAYLLRWAKRIFTWVGLLPLVTLVSRGAMALIGAPDAAAPLHPRRQVQQLLLEGVGYGVVNDEQAAMIARVLSLSSRTIADEMTPWDSVRTVRAGDPVQILWTLAETTSLTRFPVLDESGHVIGLVDVHHALLAGRDSTATVRQFTQPILSLPAATPLRQALHTMQLQHAAMAIVTDSSSNPIGLVTVKDLIEPVTGELTSW